MKIGDEVYIHGYVDEFWKDAIIIRNKNGYFVTKKSEIITGELNISEWEKPHENGHGFWVGTCKRCGKENRVNNFCPNCGAKMEYYKNE